MTAKTTPIQLGNEVVKAKTQNNSNHGNKNSEKGSLQPSPWPARNRNHDRSSAATLMPHAPHVWEGAALGPHRQPRDKSSRQYGRDQRPITVTHAHWGAIVLDEWLSTSLYKGLAVACRTLVSRCYALSPLRSRGPLAASAHNMLTEWPLSCLSGHVPCWVDITGAEAASGVSRRPRPLR